MTRTATAVHVCAREEQPCGDQSPGDKRIPEARRGWRAMCVRRRSWLCRAGRLRMAIGDADGHERPRDNERDDPRTRVLPLKLAEPVVAPCCDADCEKENVSGEIAELQTDDVGRRERIGGSRGWRRRRAIALSSQRRYVGTGRGVRGDCERWAEGGAPGAIAEAEDERAPARTRVGR